MAGIGPIGESLPAAVRPLGKVVDTTSDDKESSEKAGIYAAGEPEEELEDLNDETDYVLGEEPTE